MNNNIGGYGNTAVGTNALYANTDGYYNTANGVLAMQSNTTGFYNVANGANAMNGNTGGYNNTALGFFALGSNTTGANNIALGLQAGGAHTTGSNNIDIGNFGIAGESNVIRIGSSQTATYIAGALYNPSDRNLKQDFAGVDVVDVLNKLVALPVSRWTYKNDDQHTRHLGPVAQDFHAAFGLGADDKHIATIDEGGVALAAIKGLYLKLQASEARSRAKEKELARLRQKAERVDVLEKELAAIKARLGMK
jgi:hypothetical protein